MTPHRVGVLDTNAIVLLERLHPDDLPVEPVITVITLAELSVGPLVTDDPAERAGRRVQPPAFDALIAASAISRDLPVYTCNPRDFADIDELTVVPVPHPDGL